jgi:hypothetical protein
VHVRIEETRDDRASSQVDRARRRAQRTRLTDADDAAVPDRERRSDNAAAVHKLSIGEKQVRDGPAALRGVEIRDS